MNSDLSTVLVDRAAQELLSVQLSKDTVPCLSAQHGEAWKSLREQRSEYGGITFKQIREHWNNKNWAVTEPPHGLRILIRNLPHAETPSGAEVPTAPNSHHHQPLPHDTNVQRETEIASHEDGDEMLNGDHDQPATQDLLQLATLSEGDSQTGVRDSVEDHSTNLDSVETYLLNPRPLRPTDDRRACTYLTNQGPQFMHEFGALGLHEEHGPIFMNVEEPFCLLTVGVQGSGKSHTSSVVLENCLLPFGSVVSLSAPMAAVVFHFDEGNSHVCEAIGLTTPSPLLAARNRNPSETLPAIPHDRVSVFVSPTNRRQRTRAYVQAGMPEDKIFPLQFQSNSLSASNIATLMHMDGDDDAKPLYQSIIYKKLRKQQSDDLPIDILEVLDECMRECKMPGQSAALEQRKSLLEPFLTKPTEEVTATVWSKVQPGHLVIVDLSDPLLPPSEANGIFCVLLEQFRRNQVPGKALFLDEAHKYMPGGSDTGLAHSLCTAARMMRHEGMRIVVSTQNPLSLPREMFALATTAVLHQMHSHEWFSYMTANLPLTPALFDKLQDFDQGQAVVFGKSWKTVPQSPDFRVQNMCALLHIRPRMTRDYGASITSTHSNASNA